MLSSRTTVMMNPVLCQRVREHTERTGRSLTDFYNQALVNQLEREGDFEIRDKVEESGVS